MLPVFIMLAMAGICIGIYMIFTNSVPNFKSGFQVDNGVTSQINDYNSIVLTFEELPRLDASGVTGPLMTALIRNFTQDDSIDIDYSSTEEGFDKLLNDEIDVLISTYPSEDVLTMASLKGIELDIIPIAKDGFVFFVNIDNPIDSLKVFDIQKIYNGQVTNWSQIGGENLAIKAFQRPYNSPSQVEMAYSVMKSLQMIEAPKDVFYDKDFGTINDIIATYDNSKEAIGYSYYYETKVLYDLDAKTNDTIKILRINDVEPTYETIKNGDYPIQTNYYLIKNKANTSESLGLFVDAIFSDRGKNVIKEAGYIDN